MLRTYWSSLKLYIVHYIHLGRQQCVGLRAQQLRPHPVLPQAVWQRRPQRQGQVPEEGAEAS